MNYFPFNVGDYAAHTGHLEPMEDLAYRRLLDQYYLREGPLPADIEATAKLVRMRSMKADVESVLNEFFTLTEDGWRHSRCDAEIEKMQDKQAKARASGLASANARSKAQKASAERSLTAEQANVERSLDQESTDVQLLTPTPTPTPKNSVVSPSASPADRGSRLPTDWSAPDDWITWCRQNRPDLDPVLVADQFRDFWLAKPGKDGRKSDWFATWRNWCRGQKSGPGRRGGDASDWTTGAH